MDLLFWSARFPSRLSSAARAALPPLVFTAAVLGLASCSSPAALPVRGAPAAPAAFQLASAQRLLIVTDGGVALRAGAAGAAGAVSVDVGGAGGSVVSSWHRTVSEATLSLTCPADPAPGSGPCPAITQVSVPRNAAVTVRARNAGVSATGLDGPLNLSTVNGDVTVVSAGAAGAPVQLTTRNGSVRASGLRAPTLAAWTVNGDVDLTWASAPSQVTATTTNGSLDLVLPADCPQYAITARTRNGQPRLGLPTDSASADRMALTTVNGDITVRAAP